MQATVTPMMPKSTSIPPKSTAITTSLYDLVAAISDEVGPNEDDLVTATVMHILQSGRVKFLGDHEALKAACA
jgi:hypothetical protein